MVMRWWGLWLLMTWATNTYNAAASDSSNTTEVLLTLFNATEASNPPDNATETPNTSDNATEASNTTTKTSNTSNNATKYTGSYFVSGAEYTNTLPHNIGLFKIKKFKLTTSAAEVSLGLLDCSQRCREYDACTSFYFSTQDRSCTLTKLNRCGDSSGFLVTREGHHFYERADHVPVSPPTCYVSCLKTGDCSSCGRPNCWGADCKSCAFTCWETPLNLTGNTYLWSRDLKKLKKRWCKYRWQLWWGNINLPVATPNQILTLRIQILYNDSRNLEATFQSVKIDASHLLSVGNYTGGEAGNWWEAPFENRPLVFNASSNCKAFYEPSSACNSRTTKSVDDQMEEYMTVVERGFAWQTGNENFDNITILSIRFWITCLVNCPYYNYEGKAIN